MLTSLLKRALVERVLLYKNFIGVFREPISTVPSGEPEPITMGQKLLMGEIQGD